MDLPAFGVEEWLNKWETKAKYDISQSSIKALTLEELIELDGTKVADFFVRYANTNLDYGAIEGSAEFKQLVAGLYRHVEADNILQMNGATGGNFLALYALVNPGDQVISMLPSYQQLYDIPKSLGAEVKFVRLKEEANWDYDLDQLVKLVTPQTKLITLNSANNPTGTWLKADQVRRLAKIAASVDAYVLVDEVYEPLEARENFLSIVDVYDKGIAVSSLSKTYSLPGLRIGWTASNKEVADLFRKYRDYTTICGGVLNDALAVHALKNKDKILARNRKIVAENMQLVKEWVASEPKVALVEPESVSTAFIKLELKEDDYRFFTRLVKETGVLLVPGAAFGFPGHARLGYCCQKEVLQAGLRRLSTFLHQQWGSEREWKQRFH